MTKPELFTPQKGELKIKLVTPEKMLLFWDSSQLPKTIVRLFFSTPFDNLVSVVRIFDVTDVLFNGSNAHHYYELSVPYQHGHWFVKGLIANRSYVAELGVHLPETGFFPVFRSNCIRTPSAGILDGHAFRQDLLQLKLYEESPPKWVNHVSTYSYYEESKVMEEKNA